MESAQQSTADTSPRRPETPPPGMDEIEAAWAAGDFVFVRQGLKRQAEEMGTPFAQYRYGRVLLEGRGGPRDLAAAQLWLERAAAQNQVAASVLLARLYLSASSSAGGVARDPGRAAVLFRAAAARGNGEAQYYLGLLYGKGVGVAADPVAAFTWLQAAAETGHVAAQFELSRAFARGQGTEMNTQKASRWIQEAAAAGHGEAQFYLAYALDSGQGMRQNRAEALNWLLRSAEGGFLLSQVALGKKYLKGDGIAPNPGEALRWLGQGAQAGNLEAMLVLGLALLEGEVLAANPQQARPLLEEVAAAGAGQGQARASYALATMAEQGIGQSADLQQAVKLYRQATAQQQRQDGPAGQRLGQLAIAGRLDGMMAPHRMVPWVAGVAQQTNENDATEAGHMAAVAWLRKQAEAGLRPAQSALGQWLIAGDPAEAAQWLRRAAEAGETEAQHQLGRLYIQGSGVAQDYVSAHKWLNVAAAGGSSAALETRAVVADLMTPDQVATAQSAARRFFEAAAAGGASR